MERSVHQGLGVRRLARLGTKAALVAALMIVAGGCGEGAELDGADASVSFDAAGPSVDMDESRTAPGSCYDRVDNDRDGSLDCADDRCGADPVCCVGSAADGCCERLDDVAMAAPADGCEAIAASDCAGLGADLFFFGDPAPAIEDGALVPQGGIGHGGVALGGALDPRRLDLALHAEVLVPETRCADCVDVAGIALIDALPEPGQAARLRVAVLASGSRDGVTVVIGEEAVEWLPLPDGVVSLRIELDVDGAGRIVAGEHVSPLVGLELPPRVHAAVVGRTDNRGPGEGAVRVREATLERSACDAPDALDRHGQVLPASASTWRPTSLGRPSAAVAGDTGRVWTAFEHEGRILMAGANDDGELFGSPTEPGDPVVELPEGVTRAFDPWLMADADRFVLYFVGEHEDGGGRIYKATGGAGWARLFGAPAEQVVPEALDGVASLDGPTVWVDGDVERMIARAHFVQGGQALVAFAPRPVGEGASWALRGPTLDASIVHVPDDDLFSFERDEVASPAVVVAAGPGGAGLWRLYYGAKRGTRWSIGLLVSEDGSAWRRVGAVLEPSGAGFDALGVTDPAPLVVDGAVQLYYRGWDGARSAFGRAGPPGTMGE